MVSSQSYLTILFFFFFFLSHFSSIESLNGGFTVNLIRKKVPGRNPPHLTRPFINAKAVTQAKIFAHLGQYLMEIHIGTPPIKITGQVDTGSDLVWVQCAPCKGCYEQIDPLFDPSKSSTYTSVSCDSPLCQKVDTNSCAPSNQCHYNYGYADGSKSEGDVAQETITLTSDTNQNVALKGIVFGCGHNNTGNFNHREMGLIGMGRGESSLISQLAPIVGGTMFTQCLVPFHTDESISSRMSFGKDSFALLGNDGFVTTPMVTSGALGYPTLYSVTLQGISVEDTFLPFSLTSTDDVQKGNMIIDSGTPPIYLQQQLYDRVINEVRNKVVSLSPIKDDPSLGNQLCYATKTNLKGPKITFHFEDANVVLTPIQTFIPPDGHDGVYCLAITNTSDDDVAIYGNFAQSNYLIGFDPERQIVPFKPADCINS